MRKQFFINQARNGKICIVNGRCFTFLTHKQIHDLGIVIFELEDFDFDLYRAAYPLEQEETVSA